MNRPFVLFDLDNTLYPASAGILEEIDRRIGLFVAEYFAVDLNEANRIRRDRPAMFGTTLEWLMACHGLMDPEHYIAAVHPVDIDGYLTPNPLLRRYIGRLPVDYVLFTNSPMEHAERTLTALGLRDLFPRIWDIRRLGYRGKPHREAYEKILGDLGLEAGEALLVDDNSSNLNGFRNLGGRVLSTRNIPVSQWTLELDAVLDA